MHAQRGRKRKRTGESKFLCSALLICRFLRSHISLRFNLQRVYKREYVISSRYGDEDFLLDKNRAF